MMLEGELMRDDDGDRRNARQDFLRRLIEDADAGRKGPREEYVEEFGEEAGVLYDSLEKSFSLDLEPVVFGSRPTRIGDYRIEEEIGRGGQAIVYRARDEKLNRLVALKVMNNGAGLASSALRRFRREAEVTARLDHPAICPIYDVGIDVAPYIAMRHVAGRPLSDVIRSLRSGDEPTPIRVPRPGRVSGQGIMDVVEFVERTARALHDAHTSGIIHRDLKPGNIMVTADRAPVILDFGLAQSTAEHESALTLTGDLIGTPAYMSPEQIRGEHVGCTSDVYSLGITLFECLTLRRPFDEPIRDALFRAILGGAPVDLQSMNEEISSDLRVVVETAMARSPEDRYITALDFAEDLRRVREFKPITARPASAAKRLARWAQRNGMIAAMTAILFLLLTAGLVWTQIKKRELGEEKKKTEAALAERMRMSDVKRLANARAEASALWPVHPQLVTRIADWKNRYSALFGRIHEHESALERLRAGAAYRTESGLRDDADADFTFGTYDQLVRDLRSCLDEPSGLLASVDERLELSSIIEDRTITRHREEWDRSIEGIRSSDLYGGLELPPHVGLIPLGPDPSSGLFEFLHWQTHERGFPLPRRRANRLEVRPGTGIVLVLIPSGRARIGTPEDAPPTARWHGNLLQNESPVFDFELAAYFVSKYEVTQEQWMRMTGENPSKYSKAPKVLAGMHPVESVSREMCVEQLRRVGLALPTEVQWEHACRGGTESEWWRGDEVFQLEGAANLGDATAFEAPSPGWSYSLELVDGHSVHMPVHELEPNPFGLFHVHGNIAEWCLDDYRASSYSSPKRPGDGLLLCNPQSPPRFISRGGSFATDALRCRSSFRRIELGSASDDIGVRPVMPANTR